MNILTIYGTIQTILEVRDRFVSTCSKRAGPLIDGLLQDFTWESESTYSKLQFDTKHGRLALASHATKIMTFLAIFGTCGGKEG